MGRVTLAFTLAVAAVFLASCVQVSVGPSAEAPTSLLGSGPSEACKCADHEHEGELCISCDLMTFPAGSTACICSYSVPID